MEPTGAFLQAIAMEVEAVQGCKLTELIARKALLPFIMAGENVVRAVEYLVESGEIIEVEYDMAAGPLSGRLKSFLLPKGTHVYLRGARL